MTPISLKRTAPYDAVVDPVDVSECRPKKLARLEDPEASVYDSLGDPHDLPLIATCLKSRSASVYQASARPVLAKRQASRDILDDGLDRDDPCSQDQHRIKRIRWEILQLLGGSREDAPSDSASDEDLWASEPDEDESEDDDWDGDDLLSSSSSYSSSSAAYDTILAYLRQINENDSIHPDGPELDIPWGSLTDDDQFEVIFDLHCQIRENLKVANKENIRENFWSDPNNLNNNQC
jgi:hypothetical protein